MKDSPAGRRSTKPTAHKPVSLKQLAEHLGLNPATVSVILNDVPGRSIPQATRDRIKAAANQMNYQPNLLARSLRIEMKPELIVTLDRDISSPEMGYPVVQKLLASNRPFTALVAFNDLSAVGAIRALRDANLRIPEDISVVGFDDIKVAAYTTPRLTTINQQLEEICRITAHTLLSRIQDAIPAREDITVQPELVIRDSTGPVK